MSSDKGDTFPDDDDDQKFMFLTRFSTAIFHVETCPWLVYPLDVHSMQMFTLGTREENGKDASLAQETSAQIEAATGKSDFFTSS